MRKLHLTLLATVLLCTATTAWAADPPAAAAPAPADPEAISTPAAPIDLLLNGQQPTPTATLPCPPEPYRTCGDCFYFGQWLSYTCTTFCYNGSWRRTCTSCGWGCEL
jgi:hypothetical protein